MRFTFRQLAGRAPEAFAGHDPWWAPYGGLQRLLVGPFDSVAAARAFVATVGGAEVQSFAWRSEAGQEISRLYPPGQTPRPARAAQTAPPPPSHPARHWAQVAVGQEEDALRFTWRRFARQAPRAFAGKTGWFTPWGETNRLLAGPFDTRAEAQAFLNAAREEAQIEGLPFQSSNGQEVEGLGGR